MNEHGCAIYVPHCQTCGGIVGEDCGEWEGYTSCCNERVCHAEHDCRNTHGELATEREPSEVSTARDGDPNGSEGHHS